MFALWRVVVALDLRRLSAPLLHLSPRTKTIDRLPIASGYSTVFTAVAAAHPLSPGSLKLV
jgi:hypothetical protein